MKPVLDSLILQPYLIAVEEPQSVIPGYSKGTSWAQRIQDSRLSRSQKLSQGSKSSGSRKDNNSSVHWPYSQTQGEDDQTDLARAQEFNLGNYTSVSGKKARIEGNGIPGREVEDRSGSTDGMVILQTRTATVETR